MSDDLIFERSLDLPVSQEEAFQYHDRPGALQRLVPPWESITVPQSDGSLRPGSRVVLRMRKFGIPLTWRAEHTEYEPPFRFVDVQRSGPFASWQHEHRFAVLPVNGAAGDATLQSRMTDFIRYRLPLGGLGRLLGGAKIHRDLAQMFAYRHWVTEHDLRVFSRHRLAPQRIAISGASGLVGTELVSFLQLAGHQVDRIVRQTSQSLASSKDSPDTGGEIAAWESAEEANKLSGCDTIIHLAGESIAAGRWSDDKKQRIRDSRVIKTRQLCEHLASLERPPSVLLCASATGIYGDRGDELLTEESAADQSFLAEVAEQWEAACQPAVDAGIRVVHLRFGLILTPRGGALSKMLLPAKFAGGSTGSGEQWWSWIAMDDLLAAVYHCLANSAIVGPVNFVSPDPCRNRDFAKTLGRVVGLAGLPALIPAPAFGLRLALGEMADALLLASTRVQPSVLQESGFEFQLPDLETALRHMLGRRTAPGESLS